MQLSSIQSVSEAGLGDVSSRSESMSQRFHQMQGTSWVPGTLVQRLSSATTLRLTRRRCPPAWREKRRGGGAAGAGGTEQTGGGPGRLSHAGKGQHSDQSSTMQQPRARSHLSPSSYQHQQIPTAASVENLLALSPTRSGTGQQALWAPTEQSQQVGLIRSDLQPKS